MIKRRISYKTTKKEEYTFQQEMTGSKEIDYGYIKFNNYI